MKQFIPFFTAWAIMAAASTVAGGGDPAVQAAIADLAQRVGVGEQQVTVVSREEVTWPDGSVGCPKPGMMYTQVLVDGSRLVLEVDGKRYHYHAKGSHPYFHCAKPAP